MAKKNTLKNEKGRREPKNPAQGRKTKAKTSFERKPARERHDFAKQTYELVDVEVPDPKDRNPPSRTARIERKTA